MSKSCTAFWRLALGISGTAGSRTFAVSALAALLLCPIGMTGCGGGGGGGGGDSGSTPTAGGSATIGGAGGTVTGDDGAQVSFPPDALERSVTVRIAKDGTGAPSLPPVAEAAGAVYAITPHGGNFAMYAQVSIPVSRANLEDNEQLLLVTAQPGDSGWTVLSGATFADGKLRAPVMHFSFFQAIVIKDALVPQLVTSINNKNNIGADGGAPISADFEFDDLDPQAFDASGAPRYDYELVTRLRFPQTLASVRGAPGATPPQPCAPASYDAGGAQWFMQRNGAEVIAPTVWHATYTPAATLYPRTESEYKGGATGYFNGFGALHFYGQDSPRIGGYTAGGAALPPSGNATADDLLTWRGAAELNAQFNGRIRIDVTVPTSCGLNIAAVPLSFRLNRSVPGRNGFNGLVPGGDGAIEVAVGATATLEFLNIDPAALIESIGWEFSTDPVNWQGSPVASAQTEWPVAFDYRRFRLHLPDAQLSQSGYYRARACTYADPDLGRPAACVASRSMRVIVRTEVPGITSQPASQAVALGETASFSVVLRGAPRPTLQWQKRSLLNAAFGYTAWANVEGANDSTYTCAPGDTQDTCTQVYGCGLRATYTTPPTTSADSFVQYRLVASNDVGSAATDAALLTVADQFVAPAVTAQPGNLNVVAGGTAVFAASASGSAPLNYQWRKNGVAITGANSQTLTLPTVTVGDAALYDLVITNRAGSATTEPAALVVTDAPVVLAPTIAAPPASVTVAEGQAAYFAVAVNGTGPYTYAWLKGGAPIPGANGASFGINAATADDAGAYSVRVTNTAGTAVSTAATLTVTPATVVAPTAPVISTQPTSLIALPGGGVTFAVAFTGSGPFTFQWRHGSVAIPGATTAVLHLSAVTAQDAGSYSVEITNAVDTTTSNAAQLVVIDAPTIAQQPQSASAVEGGNVAFSVTASGVGLRYQWLRDNEFIAGAVNASYTTPALTLADNGATYSVQVYNGAGLVLSDSAVLTVTQAVWQTSLLAGSIGNNGNTDAPGGPATAARFYGPSWLARDVDGNLYVSEDRNLDIRRITSLGEVTTLASGLADPRGLAVDGNGNVYVAEGVDNTIKRITPLGVVSVFAGASGVSGLVDSSNPLSARFDNPHGLATDGTYLYVADTGNYAIRRIVLGTGAVDTVVAGSSGQNAPADGCPGQATMTRPIGIAVDGSGIVYWSEENNTVRLIGTCVYTVAGTHSPNAHDHADGLGSAARFDAPAQLSLDGHGGLFVADYGNHVVRKIVLGSVGNPGLVSTVVGLAGDARTVLGSNGRIAYPIGVLAISRTQLWMTSNDSQVLLNAVLPD